LAGISNRNATASAAIAMVPATNSKPEIKVRVWLLSHPMTAGPTNPARLPVQLISAIFVSGQTQTWDDGRI
jgi:hypothetical protein